MPARDPEQLSGVWAPTASDAELARRDGLTDRERQIVIEMAKGTSNKEMAVKLVVSESWVQSHLRMIYRKVGIRNRAQARAYVLHRGLIPLSDG